MTEIANHTRPKRVPGRKPRTGQREELLRIWGHVDDDGRKILLFVARQLAREQGPVPVDTPLMITDCVF
ncbi:hypothetical protein [Falsiroseomonas stagni]|uniref:Uncharacterized protein n=1 Tax=Falsiroseomonas stagni DSM 19981 TaxID=1123062 RepID=A0A1I4F7J1_9PROT|nr:hypothetical protein [Falsiroseomonas stagni]SFL13938.1 hypothetical protein SAMN02745775_12513 [Falsiroseomonas stagni DSM 19981]